MEFELSFLIQGSQLEPYQIKFSRKGSHLRAICTCPAGVMGQICKHRLALLRGDATGLVSGNESDLHQMPDFFLGSDVEDALKKLSSAEAALESAKAELAKQKKALARLLNN